MTNDANPNTFEKNIDDFLNSDLNLSTADIDFEIEQEQAAQKKGDVDDFDRLLDEFIANQLQEANDTQEEIIENLKNKKPDSQLLKSEDEFSQNLYPEERRLFEAYNSFVTAVNNLAQAAKLQMPELKFSAETIYPRFRPKKGKAITEDIVNCWNIILDAQPVRLSSLVSNPTDEQILEFAEKTTDENLQLSLISYVETLIELEGCEIAYNLRKAKAKKRKIERKIYEEHQQRVKTMQRYIKAIEDKKLPINAERLVTNYFKTAKKDPEGAKKMLENNPATFAPIEINKIPARFFGMIKPKPEDGIRVNKEIGQFLKKLKA